MSACGIAVHDNSSLQVAYNDLFLVALFSPVLSLALGSPYKSNLWQYTSRPVGFVSKSAIYVKTHRRGGEPREGSLVIVLNQGVEFLISYL